MNKVATASQYIALRSTTISMISTNCDCRDTEHGHIEFKVNTSKQNQKKQNTSRPPAPRYHTPQMKPQM